ncbi:MAG: dynamin family protein [Planctomycetaceae bacterium]|jgi:GTPase SAR1 family protein|nr:dynamin family protein [Planctomycetaceae bacterium]
MTTTLLNNNVSTIQIDYARMILERCQEIFSVAPPKEWASSGLAEDVEKLRLLTDKTSENLRTPTLRIAFAGATSSGKSTLVNALIGKTLMPMEAGEMSAGIVQIFHEDRNNILLNIETPQTSDDSILPQGLWEKLTDFTTENEEEVYDKLKEAMLCYHQHKKTGKIIAPNIQIRCRTILGQQTDLLQLPAGVGLEIIDLPGIREVDDAANLKSVQNVLKKTVLTVVLGYEHTSEKQIQPLLKEVSEMITLFGNSSNLFFVLNKVDRWEQGDMPISDKIKLLQDQIAPMLENKKNNEGEITIAMVSAIQLYQYQVGLGFPLSNNLSDQQLGLLASGIMKRPVDIDDDWYDLISIVAKKVAKPFEKLQKSGEISQDTKELHLANLEKALSGFREEILNKDLNLTKKRQILDKAIEESQGQSLINSLAERVSKQLPRLVIQPAVYEFQIEAEKTLATVRGECSAALTKTNEALNSLVKNLETTQIALSKKLKTVKDELKKDLSQFVELLTSNDSRDYAKVRNLVKTSNYLKPLEGVFDILEKIKQEATNKIFKKVQDYLSEPSQSVTYLQKELQQVGCAAKESGEFCNKIEELPVIFRFYPEGKIRIKKEYCDRSMQDHMDRIRKTINETSSTVVPLLASFFQKSLQGSVDEFISMMLLLSKKVRNELYGVVEKECQIDQNIVNDLIPTDDYIAKHVSILFDANSLNIPERVEPPKDETEIRTKYHNRTWSEWWKGVSTKRVAEEYEVDFIVLNFGTSDQLIENWDSTISTAIEGMAAGISAWFEKNIGGTLDFLEQKSKVMIERYQEICRQRIAAKEQETTAITEKWTTFQSQWEQLHNSQNGLLNELSKLIETGNVSQQ